jgi:hypothetical protein
LVAWKVSIDVATRAVIYIMDVIIRRYGLHQNKQRNSPSRPKEQSLCLAR